MRKREIITTARRKAIDRIVSRILVFALCITLVPAALAINALAFEEPEIVAQKAPASVNAGYTPTNLLNGKFEYHPELYPNDLIEVWEHRNSPRKFNVETEVGIVTNLMNHVNGHLNVFEPIQDNWKTTETRRWQYASASSSLFEWLNTNRPAVVTTYGISNSDGYFVEMNADGMNVLYQDLNTQYNDIILWKLDHAARMNNIAPANKVQSLQVDIGAANGQPVNTDAKINENNGTAAFYKYVNGKATVTSKHDGSESSKYGYIVKDSNLAGLTIDAKKESQRNVWQTVKGVYIVPENQPVTRFGFTSISGGTTGNFLDNVVFETLLGNVHISPDQVNDPDNIKVTGYWALTEENEGASVKYEIYTDGGTEYPTGDAVVNGEIDMSLLSEDPQTPHWSALIPKDGLEPGKYIIKVNHSDYPEAQTSEQFTIKPDVIYDANGGVKVENDEVVTENGKPVTRVGDYKIPVEENYTVRHNNADGAEDNIGFVKTGYHFVEWNTKPDRSGTSYDPDGSGNNAFSPNGNVTLYAIWEEDRCTVTYYDVSYNAANDGTTPTEIVDGSKREPSDDNNKYGHSITLKNHDDTEIDYLIPTDSNGKPYHFVGWSTISPEELGSDEPYRADYSAGAPHILTGDMTLYAVWEAPNYYTVLYHRVEAGADLIDQHNSPDVTFHEDDGVNVVDGSKFFEYEKHKFVAWHTTEPTKDGDGVYTFGNDDVLGAGKTIDRNFAASGEYLINLYAEWKPLYQITYHDHYCLGAEHGEHEHNRSYVDKNTQDGKNLYYEDSAEVMSADDAAKHFPKDDHVLLGWALKETFDSNIANKESKYNYEPDDLIGNLSEDLELYAVWAPTYNLAYHANGGAHTEYGTMVPEVHGLAMGDTVELMGAKEASQYYVRPGYTFMGGSLDRHATEAEYSAAGHLTVNSTTLKEQTHAGAYVNLYAVWAPNVTFDSKGGTPVEMQVVTKGECADQPEDPRRIGYRFNGWYVDAERTIPYDFSTSVEAPTVLYADWKHVGGGTTPTTPSTTDNTLTYESNGGTKYPTETYPNGTVVDLNKVPAKEGYIFTGWYSDAALTNKITDVTMNGSKTVYAGWKAATVPGMLNDYDHFAYVIGYPDGMVQPNGQITRAEIATIFFRLLKPEVRDGNLTTQNPFEDVKQGDWYNKPVSTMVKLGIVNGRTTTTFAPNAPITRAELATICARFDETVVDNGNLTFSDVANHWAYKEIGHAAALGWLMGYPDGTFLPDASITRAETMTLINRVLQRIPETESDLLPDMVKWPDNVSTQWYYLAVQEATNSHDFNHKGEIHETWTELTAVPDWTRYEN